MTTVEKLTQRYPSQTFAKGQTLLLKDEVPRAVYVLEKGYVKTYVITPDGTERQVTIHEKGEAMPLGYCIGLTDKTQFFYEAYSDCTVRLVPRSTFRLLLENDNEFLLANYDKIAARYLNALDQINALEHPKAGDKVAFMLLNMVNQIGTHARPSKTNMKLEVTQQEIADALGLTRETTGAELKKLESRNIISHTRKSYVLYMERLKNYLRSR